ncbi:STM4011 family radical SAM protein [Fulvivirgaceae bacterium PWU5]|uniref:STM4011 family radical SAM protein n=1 Tax=Dawidia cretensis TaxID=2782350 RepID=A0AAP2GVC1_9BACT|nr:STM4011 family radical SAM protein [Dawidia cretensis]MBT1710698.1 STM4011 family radical SAM protein [Dawidia cretensis]
MNFSILYRGPLSSCNYGCDYCPFAKTKNTRAELADDARKLGRFIAWVRQHPEHTFHVLFTPWGEALIRDYYQRAILELSHLENIRKVAIQTNLTCSTRWLEKANKSTVALWTTYHPTQISRADFVAKCRELDALGVQYSVGVVGFKESLDEIRHLRNELVQDIYLWVNAYKQRDYYYNAVDIDLLQQIDPLFGYNVKRHASLGRPCRTGESVFSLDGDGNMYRCHFIKEKIGNIYEGDFTGNLFPRDCSNQTCGCHIGYVHMPELKLDEVFGGGELERIPRSYPRR